MRTVYANALLSDGKILFWYTGDECKDWHDFYKDFYYAGLNMIEYEKTHKLELDKIGFEIKPSSWDYNNFIFEVLAKEFYKQYPISEDSRGESRMKYNRKELLSIPKRKWDEALTDVAGVYVIPSGRKHDSGYACMDFVAEFSDTTKPLVRFGGGCDDICLEGTHFRVDCVHPSRILHIWNGRNFSVSSDLSSIYFRENDMK